MSENNLEALLANALQEQMALEKQAASVAAEQALKDEQKRQDDKERAELSKREAKARVHKQTRAREDKIAQEKVSGSKLVKTKKVQAEAAEKITLLKKEGKEISPALSVVEKTLDEAHRDAQSEVESVFNEVKEIEAEPGVMEAVEEEAYREHESTLTEDEKKKIRTDAQMEKLGFDALSFSPETCRSDWQKVVDYLGQGNSITSGLEVYDLGQAQSYYNLPSRSYHSRGERQNLLSDFKANKLQPKDSHQPYPFGTIIDERNTRFYSKVLGEDYAKKYEKGFFDTETYEAIKQDVLKNVDTGLTTFVNDDPEFAGRIGKHYVEEIRRGIEGVVYNQLWEERQKLFKLNQDHEQALQENERFDSTKRFLKQEKERREAIVFDSGPEAEEALAQLESSKQEVIAALRSHARLLKEQADIMNSLNNTTTYEVQQKMRALEADIVRVKETWFKKSLSKLEDEMDVLQKELEGIQERQSQLKKDVAHNQEQIEQASKTSSKVLHEYQALWWKADEKSHTLPLKRAVEAVAKENGTDINSVLSDWTKNEARVNKLVEVVEKEIKEKMQLLTVKKSFPNMRLNASYGYEVYSYQDFVKTFA